MCDTLCAVVSLSLGGGSTEELTDDASAAAAAAAAAAAEVLLPFDVQPGELRDVV